MLLNANGWSTLKLVKTIPKYLDILSRQALHMVKFMLASAGRRQVSARCRSARLVLLGGDNLYLATASPAGISHALWDADQAVRFCSGLSLSLPQESRGGECWYLSGLHFTNYNHWPNPA